MPVLKNPKHKRSDKTDQKQKPWLFEPGKSGNPAGRPRGSRNALGERFVEAMHADFVDHGSAVIEKVRLEKPDQYLKVIASILPKELHVTEQSLSDMSDTELMEILDVLRGFAATSLPRASKVRPEKIN